jgi:hypothetical protein
LFISPATLRWKIKANQAAAARQPPQHPAIIQDIAHVDLARGPRDLDSPGYLEKRDRIFRVLGMSLRVGESSAAP